MSELDQPSLRPGMSYTFWPPAKIGDDRDTSLAGLSRGCYDKAIAESFFTTLECELLNLFRIIARSTGHHSTSRECAVVIKVVRRVARWSVYLWTLGDKRQKARIGLAPSR